ncbi:MAG: SM-20-related protein [Methylobacteriaceae bacterium]|nr:SM-20-related protein [Methylobacteriaceae bacterium]
MSATGGALRSRRTNCIDLAAFEASPLRNQPFDHVVLENIIAPQHLGAVLAAFPDVPGAGSHSPASLNIREPFAVLLAELESDTFRHAIERKFDVDLAGRPTVTTIRGALRAGDGAVHTDSRSKLITLLLYLNRDWNSLAGRLRLLKSSDLNDFAVEIVPKAGTLLAFRRSETSWHGHAPFAGPRRAIQMSYVTDRATAVRENGRLRLATAFKRVAGRFLPATLA